METLIENVMEMAIPFVVYVVLVTVAIWQLIDTSRFIARERRRKR